MNTAVNNEAALLARAADLRVAIKAADAKRRPRTACAKLSALRAELREVEAEIFAIGFAELEADKKARRRRIRLVRESVGTRTFKGFVAQDMNPARTRSTWQVRNEEGRVLSNSCRTLDEVREVIERAM